MAGRIRRGTFSAGGASSGMANVDWNDNWEFDRSKADEEFSGQPVVMSKGGSGTLTLLSGNIASGYATTDMTVTYNEVAVANGSETVTQKLATFEDVTFNQGGNVPAEGRGEVRVAFEYSKCTITTPGSGT